MRVRHKVPSVFNLYMVDVLCCALGCVILVWQLDMEKVKETKAAADEVLAKIERDRDAAYSEIDTRKAALARMEAEAASLKGSLDSRGARILALEKQVRESEEQAAALAKEIAAAEALLKDTRAAADKKAADLTGRLTAADKKAADLEAARTALDKRSTDLGVKLSDADKRLLELLAQLAAADKDKKGLQEQLSASEKKMLGLQKQSDARADSLTTTIKTLDDLKAAQAALNLMLKRQGEDLTTARSFESKWKSAEDKLALLEKDIAFGKNSLAAAERDLTELRGQRRVLESEVLRVRQAADNRFAGITLTGRRIVFLVDMSGSMELVDEKTRAPEKWSEVRNTLLKVMKSLPDLEKFQLIVFSDKASFLLGKADQWIEYDPKTSLVQVEAAMKALKPEGGTNMYSALQAAFRYRPRGLDTIYLLSDGLPNEGDGVPEAEAKRMLDAGREPELSDRLARHIRKTLKADWNRDILDARVRINTIGFFYESPDVGAFLWALARENDGSFVGMSKP